MVRRKKDKESGGFLCLKRKSRNGSQRYRVLFYPVFHGNLPGDSGNHLWRGICRYGHLGSGSGFLYDPAGSPGGTETDHPGAYPRIPDYGGLSYGPVPHQGNERRPGCDDAVLPGSYDGSPDYRRRRDRQCIYRTSQLGWRCRYGSHCCSLLYVRRYAGRHDDGRDPGIPDDRNRSDHLHRIHCDGRRL